jgi:gliding motility-associated-like protein
LSNKTIKHILNPFYRSEIVVQRKAFYYFLEVKKTKMIKRLLFLIATLIICSVKAQCPQVYNSGGVLSSNPYWLSCGGSTVYTLNFQSNAGWGPYTIIWGDGNPNQVAGSYVANSIINHVYTSLNPDTFVVTLLIPSLSCTLTGVVVMERPVNASIAIPLGGTTQACAPAPIQFINASTFTSQTSHYQWNFGDGSPPVNFTYTNAGAAVNHTYPKNTVNCQTQVTLTAWNYCSAGATTTATYSPIQIYDLDAVAITPDKYFTCWPNNVFTFSNTTVRNCVPQGNTFQRQEWWNFGNNWGMAGDSIRNWSPWPPTSPVSISYTSVGSYSVMLRDSNKCGVDTAIITISILNAPAAGVVAPGGPFCQNTPVTFTNSSSPGFLYMWNFGTGGGFVNLGPGPKTYTFNTPGTYTVQVAAFLPGGGAPCSSTANVVVTIVAPPATNFTYNPQSGCALLSNVSFTDTSVGATAWNWNFANANTSTLQIPPNQSYTTTGVFIVTLTTTGPSGCVNTKTASIIVNPIPVANFSPTSACVSAITNFTNTSTVTGTNAITSYTWDYGDGSPLAFTQNPAHTFTLAATYNVQLTVSTAFCSGTITKTIAVNPKPQADFVYSPTVGCTPLNISFTNASTGGISYLWDFGTVPTSTSNALNPSFTYTNGLQVVLNFTVSLYVTSAFGCIDSLKRVVSALPKPAASFTANVSSGCSPLPVTFTNNTIGATSYTWAFGDGNSSNLLNPVNTYTNNLLIAQTNTILLVATNSLGCTDSYSQTVTIYPKPNYSFTMTPLSGCAPLSATFTPAAGVTSYTWNFGDGSPLLNTASPVHVFTNTLLTNQTFTVNLIAANAFGCSDTVSATSLVLPKPTANYSATPISGCSPLVVSFTNSSVGNTSNSWDFDNGQTSAGTNANITFTNSPGSAAVIFSVKLLVGNASNCFDSIIKMVNLFAKPQAVFGLDTPACSPKVITFTNSSAGANTYSWNFGDGGQSTQNNPSHSFINNGPVNVNYTVSLVVANTNNCFDSLNVPVIIHPKPNLLITAQPDSGCTPLRIFFPPVSGANQYHWIYGDGHTANTGSVSNLFTNATALSKIYTVTLIAKNIYGCSDTPTKIVKIFPKPVASFQADPLTVSVNSQSAQFTNLSAGAVNFSWKFGDGSGSIENSPSHTYSIGGEYQVILIAINDKGCRDTFALADKIIVQEEPSIEVPNAFTPNLNGSPGSTFDPKDKSNDIFHPNAKGTDKYSFSIYSRWGELLFDTKNTTEGWDGYYKGKLCIQDVYIWKITATFTDGRNYSKAGDVLLLR